MQPYESFSGESGMEVLRRRVDDLFSHLNQKADDDDLGTLNIAAMGDLDVDLSVSRTNKIGHNLGYKPLFRSYFYNSASNSFVPLPVFDWGPGGLNGSSTPTSLVSSWADSSFLYFDWAGSAQQPLQSFFYYIFKNPAA